MAVAGIDSMSRLADVVNDLLVELRQGRTVVMNRELIDTSTHGLYSLAAAAKWLDMDTRTVQSLITSGVLDGRKIGKKWYVTTRSLNQLAEGRTV